MERKTETPQFSPDAFDPLAIFKPIAPAAWMTWFENIADLGTEITSFVAERIKEDVQTQHAMLHCKSLSEIQHVQAEFLQKAFEQYQAETGKLIEMSSELAEKMQPKPDGAKKD